MTLDLASFRSVIATATRTGRIDDVTGILLAAGLGRRMGLLGDSTPKPLLPVLGCPLLGWNLASMAAAGIDTVVVNTHHHSAMFERVPAAAAEFGVRLILWREEHLSGPFGGALACTKAVRPPRDYVVFAADALYGVDLHKLGQDHRENGALLTIGVTAVSDGSKYGVLDLDATGRVRAMREKPRNVGTGAAASCGVYVVSSAAMAAMGSMLHGRRPIDWVDAVRELLRLGRPVFAALVPSWRDAGTPADLLALNVELLSNPVFLRRVARQVCSGDGRCVWARGAVDGLAEAMIGGNVLLGPSVQLAQRVQLFNAVIGAGVRIGANSQVHNSVVLPGTRVPDDTVIADTIAFPSGHIP